MRRTTFARFGATVAAISLLLLALPGLAAAHAELDTPTPADGAQVTGTPDEIGGVYSEPMTSDGSSLKLLDASSNVLATGGVVAGDPTRMAISPVPLLPVGTYTVQSTTVSAADGDLDRKVWTFQVVAPAPTPVCTDQCGPGGADPTSIPTPAASAPASVAPSPNAGGDGDPNGGASAAVLPIVAAAAILVVAAIWFSRRGRRSPGA